MKRIGIVGSRRRNSQADLELVYQAFQKVYEPGDIIVSGGCEIGGDFFAEVIAKANDIPIEIYKPDKSKLDKGLMERGLGRYAYAKINYARNEIVAAKSDILIACVASDRRGGTEHTIKKYVKYHKGKENLILV